MEKKKSILESLFMELALAEAVKASAKEEVPIGAVIVDSDSGEVIAACHNLPESLIDPTAHAEMLAIKEAAKKLGFPRLNSCDLYVTLEPCPMCAQAISFARIRRLYYGASDVKGGGVENGPKIFSSSSCHHRPEIYGGIMEKESGEILKSFFQKKR